jgi:hypothetical protein
MKRLSFAVLMAVWAASLPSHAANHEGRFNHFWTAFKHAVVSDNREAVLGMVALPFTDGYGDIYTPKESLSSRTRAELIRHYDALFNEAVTQAITNDAYRAHTPRMFAEGASGSGDDVIDEGDYVLQPKTDGRDILFRMIDGRYMLTGIAYYP